SIRSTDQLFDGKRPWRTAPPALAPEFVGNYPEGLEPLSAVFVLSRRCLVFSARSSDCLAVLFFKGRDTATVAPNDIECHQLTLSQSSIGFGLRETLLSWFGRS